MNTPAAELTVLTAPDYACVRVAGRATFAAGPGFQRVLETLTALRPRRLVLDLGQCQQMDSTFLGVLSGAAERFRRFSEDGAAMELVNPNERITGLLESLGVARLFHVRAGVVEPPPLARAWPADLAAPTKLELKETSLAAHEELMRVHGANHARFAELTRVLEKDLARLRAGEPPALPGFDLAARQRAAADASGDFYEFAPRAGLRCAVLIADVCGKGRAAAALAGVCRPFMRALLAAEHPPAAVLKQSLQPVADRLPPGAFITALCLVLDPAGPSFRMARAGHDPLLWFHAETGSVEELLPKGMALGIERSGLAEATFVERERGLASGDVLLLHTDGLIEALNADGVEFGAARLGAALRAAARLDAAAIAEKLFSAVDEFTGPAPPADDQTVIVIKTLPPAGPGAEPCAT